MRKASSADFAYQAIRAGIQDGTFGPGVRLTEAELVGFCGVSRTPVREALRRLAAEDFVEIGRNQGARVKGWSQKDLDDLFSLRGLLEGHAAARAADRVTAVQLGRLREALEQMDCVLATRDSQARKVAHFLEMNRRVHETIWEAADSERLCRMLARLVEQSLVAHTARRYSLARLEQSHRHHWEVLRALEAGDAVWAESVMTSHIHAARVALDGE